MELNAGDGRLLGLMIGTFAMKRNIAKRWRRAREPTIPPNYPVIDGRLRTAHVHAAAIIKAFKKCDPMPAVLFYSGSFT